MYISAEQLLKAVELGKRIEGDAKGEWSPKPFCPPILQSSYDSGTGSTVAASDALTPLLFEGYAERAQKTFLGVERTRMPELAVGELLKAIGMICDRLALVPGTQGAPDSETRLNMQAGLQLVGVRITEGGSRDLLKQSPSALRLSNARLPFSLRLIGCVIEPPLAMSNCQLVTLDLSGSALRGLDATFLQASGSIRLRRTFMVAPADFSGAVVHGYFDAGDAILKPLATPPDGQRLDGDRGMLNLNQAHVDNDIQLGRATIWGGLSMRGLHTERSIHMDEAVILSPLGALEALTAHALTERLAQKMVDSAKDDGIWKGTNHPIRNVICFSRSPSPTKPSVYGEGLRKHLADASALGLEQFMGARESWSSTVLHQLLTHSLRARTSAVRADGLQVGGSIFAQHLRCHGRFRMKYGVVSGGLSLQGAKLLSAEAMRRAFDEVPVPLFQVSKWKDGKRKIARQCISIRKSIKSLVSPDNEMIQFILLVYFRLQTYFSVVSLDEFREDSAPLYADFYVLDIRESRFGGSVRIGIPPEEADKLEDQAGQAAQGGGGTTAEARQVRQVEQTYVDGVLALQRAYIDGELFLDGIKFEWSVRVSDRIPGVTKRPNFANRLKACDEDHEAKIRDGKRQIILARNITVTDDVSLTACENLKGADFRNATIKGDFKMLGGLSVNKQGIVPIRPANQATGRISLGGAEIAGDCFLVFDPGEAASKNWTPGIGPSIEAELVKIGGELLIAGPLQSSGKTIRHEVSLIRELQSVIRKDWLEVEQQAARSYVENDSLEQWRDERRKHPKIDLRNGQSAIFTHMPRAWPRFDRLSIVGFRYGRTGTYGPLAPFPVDPKARRSNGDLVLAVIASMSFFASIFAFMPSGIAAHWSVGEFNSKSLSALLLLLALYLGLPTLNPPFRSGSRPMALTWLRLQRFDRNDYRSQFGPVTWVRALWQGTRRPLANTIPVGSVFQSLEPYALAAKALREEGRWVSANRVEQRRLEVRTGQLSWRLHLFEKFGYSLVNCVSRYGFSYVPLFFITSFLVVGTAMVAHIANENGQIQPKIAKVEPHPPIIAAHLATQAAEAMPPTADTAPVQRQIAKPEDQPPRSPATAAPNSAETTSQPPGEQVDAPTADAKDSTATCGDGTTRCNEFGSFLFAVDTVLPAVSTGADKEWEARPDGKLKLSPNLSVGYRRLFHIAHFLGLVSFGLLLLGLSARIGLLINRYTE